MTPKYWEFSNIDGYKTVWIIKLFLTQPLRIKVGIKLLNLKTESMRELKGREVNPRYFSNFLIYFSSLEDRWRTIRKAELEENIAQLRMAVIRSINIGDFKIE